MGFVVFRDVEAHSGGEQRPEHLGESEEQQASATKRVNRPYSWPREDEVDQAEPERRKQSFDVASSCLLKNRRGIERNDVDCSKPRSEANSWRSQ